MTEQKKKIKDLGMSFEEALQRPDFVQCYEFLGKYYTSETFYSAPPVILGQCPACGEFTWENLNGDVTKGQCKKCNFSG